VASIGPERQRVNDHLFGSLSAKEFRRLCDTLSSLLDDFAYTVRLLKSARKEGSNIECFIRPALPSSPEIVA
jgi:hypothetical protein